MIDIEERALCAFEQNRFSPLNRAMKIHDSVRDERPQFFRSREVTFVHLAKTTGLRAECLKDAVVLSHFGLQFF